VPSAIGTSLARNSGATLSPQSGPVGHNSADVNSFRAIAWTTTALIILFGIIGKGPATYRYAILFLGPMLWAVYFLRHRLHIHACHFAIFATALLMHNLGAFGTYGQQYYGLEFDTYVHFYFGIAGGFIVARALRGCFGLAGWQWWAGTVIVILGLGAIHELIEYASTLIMGPEKGMLKLNSPDAKTDTQKDLLNNLLGTLLALAIYSVYRSLRPAEKKSSLVEDEAALGMTND
jgi:uncharacterized membrane protein YjdF